MPVLGRIAGYGDRSYGPGSASSDRSGIRPCLKAGTVIVDHYDVFCLRRHPRVFQLKGRGRATDQSSHIIFHTGAKRFAWPYQSRVTQLCWRQCVRVLTARQAGRKRAGIIAETGALTGADRR